MPAPKTKYLPLYVPQDLYAQLDAVALYEERIPEQQAVWILKQVLGAPQPAGGDDDPPPPSVAGQSK
jgi:hypothetical protein